LLLGFWICPSSAVAGYCYGGWILDLVVFGFWISFGFCVNLWLICVYSCSFVVKIRRYYFAGKS